MEAQDSQDDDIGTVVHPVNQSFILLILSKQFVLERDSGTESELPRDCLYLAM
jgi:hypothetical protein